MSPVVGSRPWTSEQDERLRALVVSGIVPLAVFKPAWPEEIEKARREPEPSKCNCSQFRVILDVGHTAEAPGAVSARNVPECRNSYRASLIYTHSYLQRRGHRCERPVLALGPHIGAALGDEL
jgi:N-acetylmuramoyl-L-alanine amidase